MAAQIGIVKTIIGTATATAADGTVRNLQVGDRVFADELISTGPGGAIEVELADGSVMDLGRNSQIVLDDAVYNADVADANQADQAADVDAIQAAILAGADPTEITEATAAGAGTQSGNEGADFVQVDYLAPEVTPDAGFETTGISVEFNDFEEELLGIEEPEEPLPTISINDTRECEPSEQEYFLSDDLQSKEGFVYFEPDPSNEADGIAVFTVTLSAPSDEDVTVNFQTADGTAIAGGLGLAENDYDPTSGSVTIPAGETEAHIYVYIYGDFVFEGNENFLVNLSDPTNATIADGQGIGTIIDKDEPTIALTTVDSTAVEPNDGSEMFGDAGDDAEYQVVMSNPSAYDTTVVVSITVGTTGNPIELPDDVSAFQYYNGAIWVDVPGSGEVTIPAGDTTLNLRVNPAADEIYEVIETFDVNLTSAVTNGVSITITNDQESGTIADEGKTTGDLPLFSIDDVTVTEGIDPTITFTVTKTGLTELASSVDYTVNPDSAGTPGDYTAGISALAGTLDFAAGETSKTITLNITDDLVQELTETFNVDLSGAVNGTISDTQGVGTILDNDAAPSFSIDDVTVTEGVDPTITFTVTKSGLTTLASSVDYTVNPDSAGTPGDYTAGISALAGTLDFAAGETSKTITLNITDDLVQELTETFNVDLSGAVNGTISDTQGVGTILDNDAAPSFSIDDVTVTEGVDPTITFTVTKSGLTTLASSVDYTVNPDSAGTPGDYTAGISALAGTLDFAAGETSKTITLNITDDLVQELTETFNVDLSGAVNGTISDTQGVGTILDNDAAPSFSIDDVTVTEGVDPTITFTVTKSGLTTLASSVDYTVNPDSAGTPGDYTAGISALAGTLDFAAGETSKTITLNITDDLVQELTETFNVDLSGAVNGTISDTQGVGTILDNDAAPSFSIDDVTVTEGVDPTITFTVTKSGLTTLASSVDYTVNPDSAGTPGDYTAGISALAGTLDFAAGETSKTITLNITDDLVQELTETFNVDLSGAVNGTISDTQGVGTILDNDAAPSFSIDDVTVTEGVDPTITFTVTKSGLTTLASSVDYTVNPDSAGTPGDYTAGISALAGTLDFAAGETSKTITLNITDDLVQELTETFNVDLSGAVNGTISDTQGVGTILDNDAAPSFSIDDVTVTEGVDPTITFTVTKSGLTTLASSVDYTVNPDSAGTPGDYTAGISALAGTLDFAAGETSKTITLNITDDLVQELTETFNVDLSGAVNGTISDTQGVGTILDNDAAPSFSIDDVTVTEGVDPTITFTVTKSGLTTLASSVDYTVNPDSAGTPGDYTAGISALAGTLDFAAGETSKTITLNITDDLVQELTETFNVDLSGAVNGTISDTQGVGTILDNDAAPSFSIDDVTVTEGVDPTITFTVTKSGLTTLASSVDYTVNPDSAGTPGDYTAGISALAGTLDFAAGETSKTITLNITDDLVQELTETFNVDLSGAVNGTISDTQGVGTILDNDVQEFPGGLAYSIGGAKNTSTDPDYDQSQSGAPSYLYTIDLESGASDLIGIVTFTDGNKVVNSADFNGLTMSSVTDVATGITADMLYGLASQGGDRWMVEINPATGEVTNFESVNLTNTLDTGLTFSTDGKLYIYQGDTVYTYAFGGVGLQTAFDLTNAGLSIDGMAIDSNGDFYFTENNGSASDLYKLEWNGTDATATAVLVDTLSDGIDDFGVDGLSFDNYGNLWGVDNQGDLIKIDPETGEVLGVTTLVNNEVTNSGLHSIAIGITEDQTFTGGLGDDVITGGSGSDILTGGGGDDLFVWTANDDIDVDPLPNGIAADIVTDFNSGDTLELSDLLDGETYTLTGTEVTAGNITDYLTITDDGTDTTIEISTDGSGDVTQTITLENIVIADIGTAGTQEQVIGSLIDNGSIIVDAS